MCSTIVFQGVWTPSWDSIFFLHKEPGETGHTAKVTNTTLYILSVPSTFTVAKYLTYNAQQRARRSYGHQLTSQYRLPAVKGFKHIAMHRLKPSLFGLFDGGWGRRGQGGEDEFRDRGAVRCLRIDSERGSTNMR